MNKQEAKILQDNMVFAYELAEECLGKPLRHTFHWNKRLTRTLGVVKWRIVPELHMSISILDAAIREHGIEAAAEQCFSTMVHELCHLYAGPNQGHGFKWQRRMKLCGVDHREHRFHSMPVGMELAPSHTRHRYPVGCKVQYTCRGRTFTGHVVKHNPKNIRLSVDRQTSQWNIRWSAVERLVERI